MKKNYVKPELDVVMFSPESHILEASNGSQLPVVPGEGDEFTNKRNPGWNSNNWE